MNTNCKYIIGELVTVKYLSDCYNTEFFPKSKGYKYGGSCQGGRVGKIISIDPPLNIHCNDSSNEVHLIAIKFSDDDDCNFCVSELDVDGYEDNNVNKYLSVI